MNNYKLLPALASLLETRNLTKSAEELNVSQSAMSKTLTQIREAFDDAIIVREGNKFVLTQRGEELKETLPDVIEQINSLYQPTKFNPWECDSQFKFAYTSFVASSILPTICGRLAKQAPEASVECQLWQQEKLSELSESGADLVATIASEVPENIYGKSLGQDRSVVIFAKNNPLANKALTLDAYLSARHIQVTGLADSKNLAEKKIFPEGYKRKIFARVPSFLSATKALTETSTILTAPLHLVTEYAQHFDLQIRKVPVPIEPHEYYLFWHAKHHQNPEHKWFRELCYPLLKQNLEQAITEGEALLRKYNID